MKPQKLNLANVQGKLSRQEMKEIMAGLKDFGWGTCCSSGGSRYVTWVSSCCYIPYYPTYPNTGEIFCC